MQPRTLPEGTDTAVKLDGVRIVRGGRVILDDTSLTLPVGSITAVLGPSGAGKSTLMHAITGELQAERGSIEVFGEAVPAGGRELMRLRRRIGVLLQGNGLLSDLTVAENIALPLRMHTRLGPDVIRRLVELKLNAVGLRSAYDLYPRELSGGMARRVAFARALAMDPPLMIYDEPLTGLDPIASGVIIELIGRMNRILGLTSIIVTHHVQESLRIANRVVVIANRGIVFDGTPEALYSVDDALVQQFLKGESDGPIPFDPGRSLARGVQA